MVLIFRIAVVMEMVAVNLYTLHICSKTKRKPWLIVSVFMAFTALLFIAVLLAIRNSPNYGNGNGLFVLTGTLYLLPVLLLYEQPVKYTISVACTAWIYTMLVFSAAVQLASFLPGQWFTVGALACQTLIYLLTLWAFLKFVRKRLVYILQNMRGKATTVLLFCSLSWFFLAVFVNYVLVVENAKFMRLFVVLLLFCCAFLSYILLYSLISTDRLAQSLRESVHTDALTGLHNRNGLADDVAAYIASSTPFSLFFMDIDGLKWVNDTYGHLMGDRYLINFATVFRNHFSDCGAVYRISGDEFVYVYTGDDLERRSEEISLLQVPDCEGGVPFRGVSIGVSKFPQDGEDFTQLIRLADQRMYCNKQNKKR